MKPCVPQGSVRADANCSPALDPQKQEVRQIIRLFGSCPYVRQKDSDLIAKSAVAHA